MLRDFLLVSVGSSLLLLAGCVQNTSNVAATSGDVAAGGAKDGNICSSPNPTHLRPRCDIPGGTRKYTATDRFFIEKKKIVPLGKVVGAGQPLYYVTYHDAHKFALANELVINCDSSPLNANWSMTPGRKYQVHTLVSIDGKNSYYLISNTAFSPSSWVSDVSGMLCSNGISFSDGEMRSGGLPNVYQSQPLQFEAVEASAASPKAVSVVVKEMNGATITLEMNASSGGRSFHKSVETFDLLGGSATWYGLTFELEQAEGGVRLKAIKEPVNIEQWLVFELKMPKG